MKGLHISLSSRESNLGGTAVFMRVGDEFFAMHVDMKRDDVIDVANEFGVPHYKQHFTGKHTISYTRELYSKNEFVLLVAWCLDMRRKFIVEWSN